MTKVPLMGLFFFAIFYFLNYVYLFNPALGFHCCVCAFSSCSEWEVTFQLQYMHFH